MLGLWLLQLQRLLLQQQPERVVSIHIANWAFKLLSPDPLFIYGNS